MRSTMKYLMLAVVALAAYAVPCRAEVRIKDITDVDGARSNHLVGHGLVVGLNGTGARSLSTQQLVIDMLRKMELTTQLARQTLQDNVYKSSNIAHVMVTAELPPFARKGSTLDVTVSVLDDSMSLEGGTLILTPLRAVDGEVYAVAQGQLSIGGFRVRQNTPGGQMNHPNVALGQKAAIVEREELGQIDRGGVVRLNLRSPDHATARSIMLAINKQYPATAKTIDGGTVQIRVPMQWRLDVSDFVGELGQLTVMPDTPARIVFNERTGTVIVGGQVKISAVAIAHGNLVIKPNTTLVPTTPPAPQANEPPAPPEESGDPVEDVLKSLRPRPLPTPEPNPTPLILHNVEQTYTVADLARVLNALGVSPRDLIAIFQTLKESGALHADLITQ